jgi:hypothetical protein
LPLLPGVGVGGGGGAGLTMLPMPGGCLFRPDN